MSDASVEARHGVRASTVLLSAAALYVVLDITELWSGAVSGDHTDTILESQSFDEAAEAARTKKMVIEHIFGGGGGTGAPPDPEDEDGIGRILARAVLYGSVAVTLARKLGVSPSTVHHWGAGSRRPQSHKRRPITEALRETIEELFGRK